MVIIGRGSLLDRLEIERLIAEYHSSEGLTPIKGRKDGLSITNCAAKRMACS